MRKYIALVLTLVCVLALVGCEKNDTYKIRLLYPLEVQKHSFIRTKKYQQRAKR